MHYILVIIFFLTPLFNYSQCAKAEAYVQKVKEADNWSPTERVKSGSKVQGWTQLGTWHAYKCECDKGGRTEQEAENLKNGLNQIRQTIINLYSDAGEIPPLITKCKSSTKNSNDDLGVKSFNAVNENNGVLLKDEYLGFLNSIAGDSNNKDFKKMVSQMNENKQNFGEIRQFLSSSGVATQADFDFYNVTESITQIVAIGEWVVSWFKEKEVELTPDQKAAIEYIENINSKLYLTFNEIISVPTYYEYNEKTIKELENIENTINEYLRTTSVIRALFWTYQNKNNYLTVSEIEQLQEKFGQKKVSELYEVIDNESKRMINSSAFPHMLNSSKQLNETYNKINIYKWKYYKISGNSSKAKEILNELKIDVNPKNAIQNIDFFYKENDHGAVISYYEVLKTLIVKNDYKLEFDDLSKTDISLSLCLGILSYLNNNQITQAKEELLFFEKLDNNFLELVRENEVIKARKKSISNVELKSLYSASHSFYLASKAMTFSKEESFQEAIQFIEEAILLDSNDTSINNLLRPYLTFKLHLKLKILINNKSYDLAKNVEKELKQLLQKEAYSPISKKLTDVDDLRFDSVVLAYYQGNYQKGLLGIDVLINKRDRAKYRLLQAKLYEALNMKKEKNESEKIYKQLILNK